MLKIAVIFCLAFAPLATCAVESESPGKLFIEAAFYDFIETKPNTMFAFDTYLFSANYRLFSPAKNVSVSIGFFLSRTEDSRDTGINLFGFYYWGLCKTINFYNSVSGTAGINLNDRVAYASGDAKIGGEIPFLGVNLFGEGGIVFRTAMDTDWIVNAGIRYNMF